MARWIVMLVLAAGALGVWLLWTTEREASVQSSTEEHVSAPDWILEPSASTLAPARVELPPPDALQAEPGANATEDDEEEEDPPTPAAPAPGQALLRVRAVALEGGAALEGIELDLLALDESDEEHEWRSSTQSDPARGVENWPRCPSFRAVCPCSQACGATATRSGKPKR